MGPSTQPYTHNQDAKVLNIPEWYLVAEIYHSSKTLFHMQQVLYLGMDLYLVWIFVICENNVVFVLIELLLTFSVASTHHKKSDLKSATHDY